jgi:hypothetical protein
MELGSTTLELSVLGVETTSTAKGKSLAEPDKSL